MLQKDKAGNTKNINLSLHANEVAEEADFNNTDWRLRALEKLDDGSNTLNIRRLRVPFHFLFSSEQMS